MGGSGTASGKAELCSLNPTTRGFKFHQPEEGMNTGASNPGGTGLVLPSCLSSFAWCDERRQKMRQEGELVLFLWRPGSGQLQNILVSNNPAQIQRTWTSLGHFWIPPLPESCGLKHLPLPDMYKFIFLEKPSGVMNICGKWVVGTLADSRPWAFLLFLKGPLSWKIESRWNKLLFTFFKYCFGFWHVKWHYQNRIGITELQDSALNYFNVFVWVQEMANPKAVLCL